MRRAGALLADAVTGDATLLERLAANEARPPRPPALPRLGDARTAVRRSIRSPSLADAVRACAAGRRSVAELRHADLSAALRGLLTHPQRAALERDAPERLRLPSGRSAPVTYEADRPPSVAARIQELFGLLETPRLAGGRVPVVVQLLAPNRRPVQVTDDLASFWRTTYFEVRKQLRGRYPKHAWPDDPTTARPPGRRIPAGR